MAAVMADSRVQEELRAVDALCERWASELGDWTRRETNIIHRMMREQAGAGVAGAGPAEVSFEVGVLDRILATSEPRYHALVKVWYIHRDPVMVKARKVGCGRREIYEHWRRTLEYLRGRLHAEGVNV